MNIYLDQICVNANMEKSAAKSELRDTAVIGATGVGTGLISNHVVNKLELNGKMVAKAKKVVKSPISFKGVVSTLKSKGFKNGAKIGAIGGAIGLAGDYAAVKINKRLEKTAMNKFLEKIAESYQVSGHPGTRYGDNASPTMNLHRHEYHDYVDKVKSHTHDYAPLLGAIPGGALAAKLHTKIKPFLRGAARDVHPHIRGGVVGMGIAGGIHLGNNIMKARAHRLALEDMHMTHPSLQHNKD